MNDKLYFLITKYAGDIFLFIVLGISIFGAIMIFSATAQQNVNPYFYFLKQVFSIFLGLVVCYIASKIKFLHYKKVTELFLGITIILLIFVILFGKEIKGAHRWIQIPFFGNFQPSELAKISIVLFVAKYLDTYRSKIISFQQQSWVMLSVVIFVCGLIIIQPDIGIPMVIFSTTIILLYLSGVKEKDIFKLLLPIFLVIVVSIIFAPHRIKRLTAFMNPWKYQTKEGYQLIQSYLALSYGHITGRGLGKSQFKEFYLPEAHTDFIFSVIGEEWGFVGSLCVVLSFVILFFIGLKIAQQVKSFYGSILVYGLTLNIVLQAFLNIAVTVGLVPTKGLGLPFISYGGSALITNFLSVGIILSVWTQDRKKF